MKKSKLQNELSKFNELQNSLVESRINLINQIGKLSDVELEKIDLKLLWEIPYHKTKVILKNNIKYKEKIENGLIYENEVRNNMIYHTKELAKLPIEELKTIQLDMLAYDLNPPLVVKGTAKYCDACGIKEISEETLLEECKVATSRFLLCKKCMQKY